MNRISAIELRPGYRMSTFIKGNSNLGATHHGPNSAAVLADLMAFVDMGIVTIDCSHSDPSFERLVGSFLQDLKRTHGLAKAQSVHMHTNFVPDLSINSVFNQEQVENSIDQSMARLGVDALDLVQLHWPDWTISGCLDALGYLMLMQAKGKIRYLGVINFDTEHLSLVMQSGIDIVTAQVQFSLIDQRPRGDFISLCRQHDITLHY